MHGWVCSIWACPRKVKSIPKILTPIAGKISENKVPFLVLNGRKTAIKSTKKLQPKNQTVANNERNRKVIFCRKEAPYIRGKNLTSARWLDKEIGFAIAFGDVEVVF